MVEEYEAKVSLGAKPSFADMESHAGAWDSELPDNLGQMHVVPTAAEVSAQPFTDARPGESPSPERLKRAKATEEIQALYQMGLDGDTLAKPGQTGSAR